jgi:hypothetical protein
MPLFEKAQKFTRLSDFVDVIRTKTNKTCKGRNMKDIGVMNKLTADKDKFLIFDNHKNIYFILCDKKIIKKLFRNDVYPF